MSLSKENKKIKVLVLPDLFPKDENDWVGVFVVDYVKAVLVRCVPTVFYSRLVGDNNQVVAQKFNNSFDVFRWSYKVHPNKFLKPFYYLFWFQKTVNQLQKTVKNIDVIHAHGAILNGTVAYLLSKKLNVPFVITEHTGPFTKISNSFVKRNWAQFILNKADKVLAVSKHLKKEIAAIGIDETNIYVSYNPVDTDLFSLKEAKATHKNMLFVSRLEPFKGGLRTLKAFHKIIANNLDWKLTICGEGVEKQSIINYITENKMGDSVVVKGTLTKKEYVAELHQAAFIVYPSLHESFGLIPVEAMACGLPAICTNKTAPKEYVNSKNGILVNPENIDEIAEAMVQMIKNEANFNASNIRKEVVKRFGFNNFGKNLVEIYKGLRKCVELQE